MKLLVIITRMYAECSSEKGDEFSKWKVDENIHQKDLDYVLFLQGCKYKDRIEGKKVNPAVKVIIKEISEKIKSLKDKKRIEEIGIIFHGHYDADIESKNVKLKQWGEFEKSFKEKKSQKIENIKVSFIERYSHLDNKGYSNIENIAKGVSQESKIQK